MRFATFSNKRINNKYCVALEKGHTINHDSNGMFVQGKIERHILYFESDNNDNLAEEIIMAFWDSQLENYLRERQKT